MQKTYLRFASSAVIVIATVTAPVFQPSAWAAESNSRDDTESHSTLHTVLCYLPNRLLDLTDIFRVRVRVGPGVAVGARATEVASGFVGSYASVYAGLPGPRGGSFPKSPIGLESHNGATVSLVDATVDGGIGPDYGATEIGLGAQLGIIGFDFGIDPLEAVDFITGIFTVDIQDDDF